MKTKQVLELKPGAHVMHKRYGRVQVVEVMISMGDLFGVVVKPLSEVGKAQLRNDSGVPGESNFLEDLPRRLAPLPAEAPLAGKRP